MNLVSQNDAPEASHPQYVVLKTKQRKILESLKAHCGVSHSNALRMGIELVAKEFASVLKSQGACLESLGISPEATSKVEEIRQRKEISI